MLTELSDDMKKIIFAGIGAVAAVGEKTGEVADKLVKKGEETVRKGRLANEELKHSCGDPASVDALKEEASKLTPEQRRALIEYLNKTDEVAR